MSDAKVSSVEWFNFPSTAYDAHGNEVQRIDRSEWIVVFSDGELERGDGEIPQRYVDELLNLTDADDSSVD